MPTAERGSVPQGQRAANGLARLWKLNRGVPVAACISRRPLAEAVTLPGHASGAIAIGPLPIGAPASGVFAIVGTPAVGASGGPALGRRLAHAHRPMGQFWEW